MNLAELMKQRRTLTLQVFPPKADRGMERLCAQEGTLKQLQQLAPDCIACTYGVGGTNSLKNLEVLKRVAETGNAVPLTHFTCIGNTREEVREKLQTYLDSGITHLLALRGDLPQGWTGGQGDFSHASQLIKFIRSEFQGSFTIAAAASPEGHPECRSLEADISYLRQKQDCGADYIVTQICWDMDQFRYWIDAVRKAGITLPIEATVLPVTDQASVISASLAKNGSAISKDLSSVISRYWINPNPFAPADDDLEQKKADFRSEGLEYTYDLIDQYRACDIAGIRLQTQNKPEAVQDICRVLGFCD